MDFAENGERRDQRAGSVLSRKALAHLARLAQQHRALLVLLAGTLLLQIIYLNVVPPWQVPDEPRHLGYVRELWLGMRGEDASAPRAEGPIIDSMRRHHYWQILGQAPPAEQPLTLDKAGRNFLSSSSPRGRQPATYYRLAAFVLYASGVEAVDAQLALVRLLGTLMALLVVAAAYRTARTLLPHERLFALVVGAVVALVPQRAFLAAGVNNDNLAILAGSLAFLTIVRLAVLGPGLGRVLAMCGAAWLVLLSKPTAWSVLTALGVLAAAAPFILASRRWPARRARAGALLACLAFCIVCWLAIDPGGNAAGWLRAYPLSPSRLATAGPAGPFALQVTADRQHPYNWLAQSLPAEALPRLREKVVTVGAWVRAAPAARGKQTGVLLVFDGNFQPARYFAAREEWKFVTDSRGVAAGAPSLAVRVYSAEATQDAPQTLLYSGVVAVEGAVAAAAAPPQLVEGGRRVLWDGRSFENLVANGSASGGAVGLRGFLYSNALARRLGLADRFAGIEYLLDPAHRDAAHAAVYARFWKDLFESFWGRFGWMSISLGARWYSVLAVLTALLYALSAGVLCWRARSALTHSLPALEAGVVLASSAVLSGFAAAFLRQIPPAGGSQGRYALPVVVPFALVLCYGWFAVSPRRLRPWFALVLVGLLLVLNAVSVAAIARTATPL